MTNKSIYSLNDLIFSDLLHKYNINCISQIPRIKSIVLSTQLSKLNHLDISTDGLLQHYGNFLLYTLTLSNTRIGITPGIKKDFNLQFLFSKKKYIFFLLEKLFLDFQYLSDHKKIFFYTNTINPYILFTPTNFYFNSADKSLPHIKLLFKLTEKTKFKDYIKKYPPFWVLQNRLR